MNPIVPPRVGSAEEYWTHPPPEPSPRLTYWLGLLAHGWKPNRRVRAMGYDQAAEFFGVYIWEYVNVIFPLLPVKVKDEPAESTT